MCVMASGKLYCLLGEVVVRVYGLLNQYRSFGFAGV